MKANKLIPIVVISILCIAIVVAAVISQSGKKPVQTGQNAIATVQPSAAAPTDNAKTSEPTSAAAITASAVMPQQGSAPAPKQPTTQAANGTQSPSITQAPSNIQTSAAPVKTNPPTQPPASPQQTPKATLPPSSPTTFNAQTLAKYNGQNGNPAYIAVNGKVYDVTNHPRWRGGVHKGYPAGVDYTDIIENFHDLSILDGLKIVGTYSK